MKYKYVPEQSLDPGDIQFKPILYHYPMILWFLKPCSNPNPYADPSTL